jgi:hypothetical protein
MNFERTLFDQTTSSLGLRQVGIQHEAFPLNEVLPDAFYSLPDDCQLVNVQHDSREMANQENLD